MPSILSGYEYDIFISYRHNDNRSGWVTEFVKAVQDELAATVKEPLSVYFDTNPHDGLLETHDVDGSLKDKLKCLIFIPIISRTYCDTKSFAWNNEFLEFLKIAAADPCGLKIKLPNGNQASRMLPIRIHELDVNDKHAIETELQGPLRAIDFTFQAAGVNRPLRPKDDESVKTGGQPSYRDQINKTANAISDIMAGLQGKDSKPASSVNENVYSSPNSKYNKARSFRFSKISWLAVAFILSLILLIGLSIKHFSESTPQSQTYRLSILPPDNTIFNSSVDGSFALSPDGTLLAFVARDSTRKSLLYVRPLNSLEARPLNGTDDGQLPFWSPDSKYLGFFSNNKLKKVDAAGGPAITLCNVAFGRGGSWSRDGTILFGSGSRSPLSIIPASGGVPMEIESLDTTRHEVSHRWPVFLPDGKHFFYTSRINTGSVHEDDAVFLGSLDTSEMPKMIARASSNVAFVNNVLLYANGPTLMGMPFDGTHLEPAGDPFPVAENVHFEGGSSRSAFAVSENGILAYQSSTTAAPYMTLFWRDRTGKPLGSINHASIYYSSLRLSPDGQRIAIVHPNAQGSNNDVWLYEINRKVWSRFTFDDGSDGTPIWSPDGKSIVFPSDRSGVYSDLFIKTTSGEANEVLLLQSDLSKSPTDWSRDSRFLAYYANKPGSGNYDIWILPMNVTAQGKAEPFVFLQTEFSEGRPSFSPDGRWIAYQSNESGQYEIYIRPFPGPGGKWQVSTTGGSRPRWRGDGTELFFLSSDFRMMSAQIMLGATSVEVGKVEPLFLFPDLVGNGGGRDLYDVTSDGQKFLVESSPGYELSMRLTLVVNWIGEIKKK